MENETSSALRKLTDSIRYCESSGEMARIISGLQISFNTFSIEDQSFLLALIGITMMNLTTDSSPGHCCNNAHELLNQINWNKTKKMASS